MTDYRFHCEDCDSYSQCQYYHNCKGTSLICKEFQYGSSVIEQIRDEIEEYRDSLPWESNSIVKWNTINYILEQIIDKYKGE